MEKLTIEIPLIDAIKTTPVVKRCLKRMLTSDMSQEESVMMISEVCSAVIQNIILEKLKDPGSFVLDCSIFKDKFKGSLCDLGSSVSLMPYSVAGKLGITDFTPTRISLILADRSVRIPEGLLEDVPVRIGEFMIPTDFIVLKYNVEPKDPLILGIPFLATAGALFDVRRGKISLNVRDLVMNFDMDKLVKQPTIDGQTYYVDTLSNLAKEIFLKMLRSDPLEKTLVSSGQEMEHLDDIAAGYVKMLDASECMMQLVKHEELGKTSPKVSVSRD
ncbi:hypothetical protein V5N11_009954 [Cardamine amara subsp. amara]|uniref:Aspartic peptidase DDI1-type domain-containing protein n=1 Tax=Cardamine amara subsp. amara TaxID=228776 RepID=A0ABD1B5J8_CARAN